MNEQEIKNYLTTYYYEIEMFDFCFKGLQNIEIRKNQQMINVYLECFLLHSRNIYEFFFRNAKKTDLLSVKNFINDWNLPKEDDKEKIFWNKISDSIHHMHKERETEKVKRVQENIYNELIKLHIEFEKRIKEKGIYID